MAIYDQKPVPFENTAARMALWDTTAPMPTRPVVAGVTPKPAVAPDTRGMTRTMPGQYDPLGQRSPETIAAGNAQQVKYAEQKIADAHQKELNAKVPTRRLVYNSNGDIYSVPTMGGSNMDAPPEKKQAVQEPGGWVPPKEAPAPAPVRDPFAGPPEEPAAPRRMAPVASTPEPTQGMYKSNPVQDALLASASAQADREQRAQDILDHMPQLDTSSIGKWLTSAQQIKRAKGMAAAYTDINKHDPLATASAAQTAETTTGMTSNASLAKELMGNQTSLQVAGMQAEASKYGHDLTFRAAQAATALKLPAAQLDAYAVQVLSDPNLSLDEKNNMIAASKGTGGPQYSQTYNQDTGQMDVLQTKGSGGIGAGNIAVGGVKTAALAKKVNVLNTTLGGMNPTQIKTYLATLQKTDPEAVQAWISTHNK